MTAVNTTRGALTVFYDGDCPICALEIEHLQRRCRDGSLLCVDISAPAFDAGALGKTHAALDARIHGRLADGTLIDGMPVLRRAYAAAGLGGLMRATGWPVLRPLFDAVYSAFARHRRAISRALVACRAMPAIRRVPAARSIEGRPQ